ncbi:MAG: hypothetical protein GSR79_01000 [Desulfurococcales archaeon]|nr:hypothetical protein [Desulfurococcales archaeon]
MCITNVHKNKISVIKKMLVDLLTRYSVLLNSGRLSEEGKLKILRYVDIVNTVIQDMNNFTNTVKSNNSKLICSDSGLLLEKTRSIYMDLSIDEPALLLRAYIYQFIDCLKEIKSECCMKLPEIAK